MVRYRRCSDSGLLLAHIDDWRRVLHIGSVRVEKRLERVRRQGPIEYVGLADEAI